MSVLKFNGLTGSSAMGSGGGIDAFSLAAVDLVIRSFTGNGGLSVNLFSSKAEIMATFKKLGSELLTAYAVFKVSSNSTLITTKIYQVAVKIMHYFRIIGYALMLKKYVPPKRTVKNVIRGVPTGTSKDTYDALYKHLVLASGMHGSIYDPTNSADGVAQKIRLPEVMSLKHKGVVVTFEIDRASDKISVSVPMDQLEGEAFLNDFLNSVCLKSSASSDAVLNDGLITVYSYCGNGQWGNPKRFVPKSIDKMVLDPEVEQTIRHRVDAFRKGKQDYMDNDTAYKTGMCFYGPPGTGKTSMAEAVAFMLGMPIYKLSLTADFDIKALAASISTIERGVILMEDMHTAAFMLDQESKMRKKPSEDKQFVVVSEGSGSNSGMGMGRNGWDRQTKLNLNEFLGLMDGLGTRNELVWIGTMNAVPHDLDHAVRRTGRFDTFVNMGACSGDSLKRFYRTILEHYPPSDMFLKYDGVVTPAMAKINMLYCKGLKRIDPDIDMNAELVKLLDEAVRDNDIKAADN